MAATYIITAVPESWTVFQQEKTGDNKFFAQITAVELLTFTGVLADCVPTSYAQLSIPFNADNCMIDEIILKKKTKFVFTQGGVALPVFYDIHTVFPILSKDSHVFAGFSGVDHNASAIDLQTYMAQNYVNIPLVFFNDYNDFSIQPKRNFKFKNTRSFINAFIWNNYDCGNIDIEQYTLTIAGILNAQSGIAATLTSISNVYTLSFSGLTEKNYNK